MQATTAIDRVISHARIIASGEHETVKPGMDARITEAWIAGDCAAQGDLYLEVVESPPKGYRKIEPFVQLVPGNTVGAKHCLDGLSGVMMWVPRDWPEAADFLGPCFRLSEPRTVLHPTHGNVQIPAWFTILCSYQKEWDAIHARERRNAD
jgi:hypothetical protein